ncbi:MAG TPA: alpha/beta fold hydrolase [Pseudonocardia sp.]|jgi:pimeloyl-ACP methyl ester carboxylesterase|nr:alpha/beta fold hydrolase [Pseudonocardia sp.]
MSRARTRAANTRRNAVLAGLGIAAVGVGAASLARSRYRSAEGVGPVEPGQRLPTEHIDPDTEGHRGGSGTPLLLLHGISVTWRSWKPVLPLLEKQHDVIAPTLLGHSGAAPLPEGVEPSLEAIVDGVEAELDRLGLDKVHVAGNSMGGWVSLELARRGRARSVTVFSSAGAFGSNFRIATLVKSMGAGVRLMESHGHRIERLAWTPRGRRLLAWSQFEHPERADPIEIIADIRAIRNAPVVRPLLKVLADKPMEPLPDPGCPIRVVWARKDRVIPYKHYGQPLLERLPSAELIMLDGVGHVPMTDDPETVARLITEVTSSVDRLHTNGTP